MRAVLFDTQTLTYYAGPQRWPHWDTFDKAQIFASVADVNRARAYHRWMSDRYEVIPVSVSPA